jgi:hypothetical protein
MIQVDAMVDDGVSTVKTFASLVIYAFLMILGMIVIAGGILIHEWHDDGPKDDQSRESTGPGGAEVSPGEPESKGKDTK